MINLLLVVLMVAALGGMVFCGREQRRRPVLQLIALLLLVLVIASGGMFMCRLGALSVLGFDDSEQRHAELDKKLREAQGYVVANFIKNRFPNNKKVLLISNTASGAFNQALLGQLHDSGVGALVREPLTADSAEAPDNLITPVADRAAEAQAIDAAIAKHPDAGVVILAGIAPSGESLARLGVYRMPESTRPKIIVIGLANLTEWVADQIEKGLFSGIVITDLTKASVLDETLPENPIEVFNSRFVLINKDNLNRNRRFFR